MLSEEASPHTATLSECHVWRDGGWAGQGTTQALHEGGPVSDGDGGGDADGVCDITRIRACVMPHCGM